MLKWRKSKIQFYTISACLYYIYDLGDLLLPLVDPGLDPLLDVEPEWLRLRHRQHLPLRQLWVLNTCTTKRYRNLRESIFYTPLSKKPTEQKNQRYGYGSMTFFWNGPGILKSVHFIYGCGVPRCQQKIFYFRNVFAYYFLKVPYIYIIPQR